MSEDSSPSEHPVTPGDNSWQSLPHPTFTAEMEERACANMERLILAYLDGLEAFRAVMDSIQGHGNDKRG
jgi:hypothetical protein